ncbi:hypothetical protein NFI95_08125 [Acetobacteraceae bacterium KSS8]|uniref:Uncharacterized protein n=1 Tax=Endosaccharibacter trunci TaxID=2812733 RepID=A0ABT1W9B8_9PROT|nr:hypothetical protein [Acetobacteraceae bacterium KSS8]
MTSDIFVDPSVAGPDVLFSTGQVVDGEEQFFSTVPDIAGQPDTGWNITQWATPTDQIFDPARIVRGDPEDADPLLGAALASWHTGTAQGGSALAIYGTPDAAIFRLGVTGGSNKDTFLQSTGYASGSESFDRQILFQAQERIVTANAGTGTAIAFNGFTVFFNASDNPTYSASLPQTEMFLQVPLTDFRGEPGAFTTLTPGQTYQQIYNLSSWTQAPDGTPVADESADYLAFQADGGALHTVQIDLNQALLRMIEVMAAQNPALASAYMDMSRWSLGSVYSGVETGGGDGDGAATLSMDIAHVSVTRDDSAPVSSDSLQPGVVQTIDDGDYAESEDATRIETLAGARNTVRLTNALGAQTFTGRGDNSVLIGDGIDATLHGLGSALSVTGSATRSGTVSVDGTAPLSVSGSFAALTVQSGAPVSIDATVSAATLSLGGAGDAVSIDGYADATLSGINISFAAGDGTVSLSADGGRIDQNGGGRQIAFLNGHQAILTQSGTGNQIVVGRPESGGQFILHGGAGTQTVWTGNSDAQIDASGTGTMQVVVQAGSQTQIGLGGENATIAVEGGALTLTGGTLSGQVQLSVDQGQATVQGGAETMVASVDTGRLQIAAGSGDQVIFGGGGAVVAMGSHDSAGHQTLVDDNRTGVSNVVFGGKTAQVIWTGQADDTIVSSIQPDDSAGRIDAVIQGGASSYWGGVEAATLSNLGGILDAFLTGTGAVSIQADMTNHTSTTVTGFSAGRDSLLLQNVADPSLLSVQHQAAGALIQFEDSRVMLNGVSHVSLSQTPGGIVVLF